MELKIPNIIEDENIGDDFNSEAVEIDAENHGLLLDILFNQMYKNAIGSICREIACNCFDSHKEAGVSKPIVIKIGEDEGGGYISFIDYGVGLSRDRINKVYRKPLSSTKRNTINQIGAFGLGSKTPIAYTDSFIINTVFDGVKYQYLFAKNSKGHDITLLQEQPSEENESNGTEIKIYFKESSHRNKFIDECRRQLAYFKDIFYINIPIDNTFRVYEAEHFLYRANIDYELDIEDVHLAIGEVMYPIDWSELGRESLPIAIALKFQTSDFIPGEDIIPSRESLRYNDKVKNMINEKLMLALQELEEMHKSQSTFTDSIVTYFEKEDDIIRIKIGTDEIRVNPTRGYDNRKGEYVDIYPFERVKPQLEAVKDLPITLPKKAEDIFYFLDVYAEIGNGKLLKSTDDVKKPAKGTRFKNIPDLKKLLLKSRSKLYRVSNKELDIIKNDYIGEAYLVRKKKIDMLEYRSICANLKIPTHLLGKAQIIKKYQSAMTKVFVNETNSYDKLEVPMAYIIQYKESRRKQKIVYKVSDEEIKYEVIQPVGINNISKITKLKDLAKESSFIFYGFKEDKEKLDLAYLILLSGIKKYESKAKVGQVIMVNKAHQKQLANSYPNIHHVDMFLESKNRVIRDVATAHIIEDRHDKVFSNNAIKVLKSIDDNIVSKYTKVRDFINKYSVNTRSYNSGSTLNKLLDEIADLSANYNFYNHEILDEMNQLEDYIKGIELINYLDNTKIEKVKDYVIDYMKAKRKRLPSSYYLRFRPYELELMKQRESMLEYNVMVDLMKQKVQQ